MSFVHLHVHSEYSLLDGFSKIEKLVRRACELKMPALALTDHGTMFGAVEFFNAATAADIKPIIGLETYLAARGMTDREPRLDKTSSHLLLLAENQTGYQNLLKIASASQLNGFYYYPRIDRDFLAAHSEGLIATSGCMSAEIPRALREGDIEKSRWLMDWYLDVFGADRFYIELQQHEIKEIDQLNRDLIGLARRYQARLIATNDVHYVDAGDARYQDILLAIQTGSLLKDTNRMRMTDPSYYLRSPQEMGALFSEQPEALANTLAIAERCQVNLRSTGYHLPLFEVPEGHTCESYLRQICEEGLQRRYGSRADDAEVRQRFEYELQIIHEMGFDAYFLIVWDLCCYARQQNIWYTARGSANGSLVAHTLDITIVDPLTHGLIFERFLAQGRVTMPDIDLDFQDDQRARVMEFCANKYGSDRVAQIITFGTLGAKAAIRDVGRVMDIPLSEVERVSKLISDIPGKSLSVGEALAKSPELSLLYRGTDYLRELIDTAGKMEGVVRSAGTHPAGVIISDKPIVEYLPLHRPTSGAEDSPIKTVAQFEMSVVDDLGLLKVDFLGLASLTIIARACGLIAQRHGRRFNLENIPADDPATYDLLSRGQTAGIFQVESAGMTRWLMQMMPKNLAHIIAMVALYRPGPMESIPRYLRRMQGQEAVTYPHPALEPIFKETYGIPIYQEQIMFAAMKLAGYPPSEADDLRKAIAKKNKDALTKHRARFVSGAVKQGITAAAAESVFDDWENFAQYGFNKSHAAVYGLLAVQTAYLKTNFTIEYMTAVLSASKNETAKVAFYVADCRSLGIEVLGPDINASGWDFTIEDRVDATPAVRFGLGAIKNVGRTPVDLMLSVRAEGSFRDLNDLARRVDLRQVGKRALEALVRVGALDAFGSRTALQEALDHVLSVSASHFRAAQVGQMSFFGTVAGIVDEIKLVEVTTLDTREKLEWERELLGLYVSDHPLSVYLPRLKQRVSHSSMQLAEADHREAVTVAGLVTGCRSIQTKTGKPMAFVTIEDVQGTIELVVFPRVWEKYRELVVDNQLLIAEGKTDNESGEPKVLVDRLGDESSLNRPPPKADMHTKRVKVRQPMEDNRQADTASEIRSNEAQSEIPASHSAAALVTAPDFDILDIMSDQSDGWEQIPPPFFAHAEIASTSATDVSETPGRTAPEVLPAQGFVAPTLGQAAVKDPPAPKALPVAFYAQPARYSSQSCAEGEPKQRMLKVVLLASGDKHRDVRRLRRIYGMLQSYLGVDRFCLLVHENGYTVQIEFPNLTTRITPELIQKLSAQAGEENILVEPIKIH